MTLVRGDRLTDEQRRHVLAAYIYRGLDTTSASDAEWLAKHAFYITRQGRLSNAHKHCEPAFMATPRGGGLE